MEVFVTVDVIADFVCFLVLFCNYSGTCASTVAYNLKGKATLLKLKERLDTTNFKY